MKIPQSSLLKVTVFTPTHGDNPFLDHAYYSLLNQTYKNWEWIVGLNNGAEWRRADPRVKILNLGEVRGVGEAKRRTLEFRDPTSEVLVELDHDDELMPNALESIVEAYDNNIDASLIYSKFAQIDELSKPDESRFGSVYGWEYTEEHELLVPNLMQPTPHNVSLIWYAPNHVRAFSASAYDYVGGYDSGLDILDDLDLMARLYRIGEFVGIDELLYLQRVHSDNTQKRPELNGRIQIETWDHYENNIQEACYAWSERNGLESIHDLDCANAYVELDQSSSDSNSHGYIRTLNLSDATNPEALIQEFHRLLAPNGMLLMETPYWGEAFFRNLTAIPADDEMPKWQESRIRSYFRNGKPYVQANLIAIKLGYTRDGGILG